MLSHVPDGWNPDGVKYVRNNSYKGLFRKLTVNELSFVREGKTFIDNVYEREGSQGEITIMIKELSKSSYTYTTIFTGILDLTTYKKERFQTSVQVIDTTFNEKVKSRENTKVDLRSLKTIEDEDITPFSNETPELTLPHIITYRTASWKDYGSVKTGTTHNIPLNLTDSDMTEAQAQNGQGMFENANDGKTIEISGVLGFVVQSISPGDSISVDIKVYDGVAQTINLYDEPGYAGTDDDLVQIQINESVTINSGESIKIEVTMSSGLSVTYGKLVDDVYYSTQPIFSEKVDDIASSSVSAYPVYESFLRILQIITGEDNPLKSTKFGRTDSELTTYDEDGELTHITKGMFIREMDSRNNSLAVSLRDLFDAMNCIFNIGLGVETIGGVEKVVIEEMTYFYDNTVIIDYSERIDSDKIVLEAAPEYIYNRIEIGYDSYNDEETEGVLEFNTTNEYSTIIKNVDNLLSLKSRYRSDTTGIKRLRIAEQGTEDMDGDDDIFIIACKRGASFDAVTNDDYDWVKGGFDADQCMNLDYSPARNLRRHGRVIRAGLELNTTSKVKWQKSEKNTQLQSKRTDEASSIDEDADVVVSEFDGSYWKPEIYSCDVPFTRDDLAAVEANPKGIIKLGTGAYGWILEINSKTIERTAEIRLLRVNTDVVSVVELIVEAEEEQINVLVDADEASLVDADGQELLIY